MWILIGENKLFNNRKEIKKYLGGQTSFDKKFKNREAIFITKEIEEQIKNK